MAKKLYLFVLIFFVGGAVYAQDAADTKYWIIFKDKGKFSYVDNITPGSDAYNTGIALLSERAVHRRLKVLPENKLIDFGDLPLENDYVKRVEKLGVDIIAKSRWLNGVSAYLSTEQASKVKKLDCVSQMKVVNKLFKQNFVSLAPVENYEHYDNPVFHYKDRHNILNYGNSFNQMNQIDVPKVHNLGITGKDVIVASFDDGFEWRNHEALKELKISDEYDFVNNDGNTFSEPNQKYEDSNEQGWHGTATLSSMAGYKTGKLIGPAFNSEFLLAKTEYTSSETPMEEDDWLQAAEWVELKGADIITSSLVYKEFDKPFVTNSYKYENFDGKTAITTIAGTRAAYLGIVVLNAMGNYYQTGIPSLGSAADGDSIISVGAVSFDGNIANFSSNGPTSDGRTKPDVCAMGVNVYVASKFSPAKYDYSNGTSFATPITAGVCALILSAHPELTPMQVREALRMTANNSSSPNNIMGWGLINAYNALLYYGMVWSNEPTIKKEDNRNFSVSISLASKYLIDGYSVSIFYSTDNGISFSERKMAYVEGNDDGNKSGLYNGILTDIPPEANVVYYFYAKNFNGEESFYPLNANIKPGNCFSFKY